MDSLITMFANYKTTIGGFVLGVLYYLAQTGTQLPHDGDGWLHLLVSCAMAGIGYVAKDATTAK